MSAAESITLRIGWWNTSLRGAEVVVGHLEATCAVLTALQRLALVDIFLLGETAQPHLGSLRRHLNRLRPGARWRLRTSPRHDEVRIGVLFDESKAEVGPLRLDAPIVEGSVIARQVVTGLRFEGAPEILLVVVHWPSRLHDAQQRMRRDRSGEAVRGIYRSLVARSTADAPPYLVVMGDFNDEPFDRSIAEENRQHARSRARPSKASRASL